MAGAGVRLREVPTYWRLKNVEVQYINCQDRNLMSTYGRCLLMGGVHLWEMSAYGRCPLMGGVHLWEVSTYGRCLLMGGVHLREVYVSGASSARYVIENQ